MAETEELIFLARAAARQAYAPYSNYSVGAAAVFKNAPSVYTGCNVENASYGLTICAERVAVCAAVAAGFRELAAIAITAVDKDGCPLGKFTPCGACRQFLAEFATDKTVVIVDNCGHWRLSELFPHAFELAHD